MSSQAVLPPYQITSAYEGLLRSFQRAAEDGNSSVSMLRVPLRSCFRQVDEHAAVEFMTCLYLKDWPCRRLPASKQLHIGIKAIETLNRQGWILTRSTVYLDYFIVTDSMAQLVQSLHYDFVEGGQDDHPIFHLHLSDEAIPENDLRSMGFDLEMRIPEPSNMSWVTTIIPTPDMTLASVLYCLVAYHLGAGIFRQFADSVHSIQDRLPPPMFDALKTSLGNSSLHFKSSHWFAHMRGTAD